MKYFILSIAGALALIFSLQSCNEKIDLIGDFEETAVVYGLLDQSDSVHMIKITRAFIGPGNSLEIAQDPDSSYFETVNATISEYDPSGALLRTWNLNDTLIDNKDQNGIFYAPEQKVYVFYTSSSSPLVANATYKLNIDINNGEFEVTGETGLVSGLSTNTDNASYTFKFADNNQDYKSATIAAQTGNSFVLNCQMDIHFSEFIGTDSTIQTTTWTLGEYDVEQNSTQTFVGYGETFYQQIANKCATGDPLVDKRNFVGITVRLTGGAEDLYNYMLVNEPSSTLAQNKPTYTNLTASGEHRVIGIFSSRYTKEVYHEFTTPASQFLRCLDKNSTQKLCVGSITSPYLFCSQHPQDIFPSPEPWSCP